MDRAYFRNYFGKYYQDRKAEYLIILGGRCANCGDTKDLEFDHIDPSGKLFNITEFLSRSREATLNEIAKCQILCKPCHKLKTYKEAEHGTTTMYRHGCRCGSCSGANTENMRRWRLRKAGH